MGFKDDLTNEAQEILDWKVEVTSTNSVPTRNDLTYGPTAKSFETAVLYADVRGSSKIPEDHRATTGAKIFNAFLNGAIRIVKKHGGQVRSFNGDSLLVFFDPTLSNPADSATKAAMQMKWYVEEILRPKIKSKKYEDYFDVGIGVTYGKVITTKIGIKGGDNNDLIWPATPVNFAAKLGDACSGTYNLGISKAVYDKLSDSCKFGQNNDKKTVDIWTPDKTFTFAGSTHTVYKTSWRRRID